MLVSWTQPQGGASGYAVVYRPTSTPPSQALHVRVEDAGATNYTIQSVETEANYTVQVLAYIHLPSSLSQAATVYLDGTHTYTHRRVFCCSLLAAFTM